MEQYKFTVHSKGLCVICLAESSSKTAEVSVQSIASYLKLNYKKIFNITVPTLFPGVDAEAENDSVDINVTLCRSCADLRNKFYRLHKQMEDIQQSLNSCVQTMLEAMINAESNVIRSRWYQRKITGVEANGSNPNAPAELIKITIPDKFRKEAMWKCVQKVEKAGVKQEASPSSSSRPGMNPENVNIEETLEFECSNDEQMNEDFMGENGEDENLSDEDEDMKIDEDADPEELMLHYNAFPGRHKHTPHQAKHSSNQLAGLAGSGWNRNGNFVNRDDDNSSGDASECGTDNRSSFNSRFKCKICGKVVVSLKNFELHQRRHTGEKPFACPFCDQHFRDTSNLRSHTLRYHRQFMFANFKEKDVTDEQFKVTMDKIVQSIVVVTSTGVGVSHQSNQCYLCNKEYTQKYAIEDHIVQRHYDVLATAVLHLQQDILSYDPADIAQYMVQIQESGDTCTICGLCGQQFQSGIELCAHMKVHVKVKVARSQGGVQKADTSDSLIQLKMKCNLCSKYFEDLNALTRHKTLHKGNCASAASRESVYNCEHCGRNFCSYYSQRSHVLTFHRYQVFSKYLPPGTTPAQIESVVKGITGKYTKLPNGLFQCSLCKKEITQSRKLQSHMLVTHFDEVLIKLKLAINNLNVAGESQPPELDLYENSNDNINGAMALYEDFNFDDGNFALGPFLDGDASDKLEVLISCPD